MTPVTVRTTALCLVTGICDVLAAVKQKPDRQDGDGDNLDDAADGRLHFRSGAFLGRSLAHELRGRSSHFRPFDMHDGGAGGYETSGKKGIAVFLRTGLTRRSAWIH